MKTKWMCVASLAGTMLVTGCHTAANQSGQEKTEPIAPTFTITTKPQIYVTDLQNGKMMNEASSEFFDSRMVRDYAYIYVDPNHQYDEMIGFGGAITDAAAETLAKLPKEKQEEIINAYYDAKDGIGYTVVRTNMNSCDFSSASYDYVAENDSSLQSFDIAPDRKFKLPMIKMAQEKIGDDLIFYISPWSPPAWMKTNNHMLRGGELKKEFYQTWADYFIKYIKSYEAERLPVWALTIQNEPQSVQTWESCIYDADMAHDFIKNYMGPTLEKNQMQDCRIIAWDHNRDFAYHYVADMLNDPETAKYIWGVGFHWYDRGKYENIDQVKRSFPDKKLAFTEGCGEWFNPEKIHSTDLGETYATNIINDLNRGCVLWTDWNVLLDEKGGPNHVGNFCFAPVHGLTETGEVVYTSAFPYIGHFSKFIHKGARRLTASSNRFQLQTTSFINPDGTIVVVVLNASNDTLPYSLFIDGKEAKSESTPHSIVTWVF